MNGLIAVILVIGVLAVVNMKKDSEVLEKINVEKKIDKNNEIVNIAKDLKAKSSLDGANQKINKLNEISKTKTNPNISPILEMARKVN